MPFTRPGIEELLERDPQRICQGEPIDLCVRIVAVADLPTRFGDFQIVSFYNSEDEKDHVAVVKGDVMGREDVPVRIHSECLTGDALGSLRCDCRDDLTTSRGNMEFGMTITSRIPMWIKPNPKNRDYLRTKMNKSSHMRDDIFTNE